MSTEHSRHGSEQVRILFWRRTGAKISHRRLATWGVRSVQNTFGAQVRNDDISNVALYHTKARTLLDTVRQDAVLQTSGAVYVQNEVQWVPWLRTLSGLRVDGYRFRVDASDPANAGTDRAGLVSPKGGAVIGPWQGTELYVNAGLAIALEPHRESEQAIDVRHGLASKAFQSESSPAGVSCPDRRALFGSDTTTCQC